VLVGLHAAEDFERFGQRLTLLVRAILRRQRLEDVGNAHAARLHGHLIAGQPARVSLAIHAFVVAAGVLRHAGEVLGPR